MDRNLNAVRSSRIWHDICYISFAIPLSLSRMAQEAIVAEHRPFESAA